MLNICISTIGQIVVTSNYITFVVEKINRKDIVKIEKISEYIHSIIYENGEAIGCMPPVYYEEQMSLIVGKTKLKLIPQYYNHTASYFINCCGDSIYGNITYYGPVLFDHYIIIEDGLYFKNTIDQSENGILVRLNKKFYMYYPNKNIKEQITVKKTNQKQTPPYFNVIDIKFVTVCENGAIVAHYENSLDKYMKTVVFTSKLAENVESVEIIKHYYPLALTMKNGSVLNLRLLFDLRFLTVLFNGDDGSKYMPIPEKPAYGIYGKIDNILEMDLPKILSSRRVKYLDAIMESGDEGAINFAIKLLSTVD